MRKFYISLVKAQSKPRLKDKGMKLSKWASDKRKLKAVCATN